MQDPGLYLKDEGHNHRSKVKKWDISLWPDCNSVSDGWILISDVKGYENRNRLTGSPNRKVNRLTGPT